MCFNAFSSFVFFNAFKCLILGMYYNFIIKTNKYRGNFPVSGEGTGGEVIEAALFCLSSVLSYNDVMNIKQLQM